MSVGFPAFYSVDVIGRKRGSITVDWVTVTCKAGKKAGIHPGYSETVAHSLCGCRLSFVVILPHCRANFDAT